MAERRTLVSVDLDDLDCYLAVHGHGKGAPSLALTRWLPRFLDLFDTLDVKATFFVIGRDLQADVAGAGEGAAVLRRALAAGHELASHGYAHAYDFSRWSAEAVSDDLRRVDALLRDLGAEPTGFRAPGYTQSAVMLQAVASLGYRYDSSVLPSLPYYAAKVAVMGAMALRGRRSASLLSGAGSFHGPMRPWRRTDVPLVELPMAVSPWLRLPLIGTTLLGGPELLRRRLVSAARALPDFHLELHAIDLGDAQTDEVAAPLPELSVPFAIRQARLQSLLRERGPTTLLRDAAASVA
ncbi:MAG: polysaccharide deacetylase family protein [Myxococcota bacterium]